MKKFCVLSGKPTACGRIWHGSQDDAVTQAARIMDSDKSCHKLFIVELVGVVERPIPSVEVRLPKLEDTK